MGVVPKIGMKPVYELGRGRVDGDFPSLYAVLPPLTLGRPMLDLREKDRAERNNPGDLRTIPALGGDAPGEIRGPKHSGAKGHAIPRFCRETSAKTITR